MGVVHDRDPPERVGRDEQALVVVRMDEVEAELAMQAAKQAGEHRVELEELADCGSRSGTTIGGNVTDPMDDEGRVDERLPQVVVPAVLGGSAQVGDAVFALGHPLGLNGSLSAGVVSALDRTIKVSTTQTLEGLIQFDAAVNPGNSGGPLFDGSGSVVGINAQIYSRSGGFQGVSFAIPIDVALKVKEQIVATGKARHGRLGVTVQDLNQSLADSFGLKQVGGALISNVAPGSAAAEAGLKSGDVITEVNGEPVLRSGSLSSLIGMAAPGDRVKLKVWRDHAERTIDAKLGGADENAEKVVADAGPASGSQLGLSLRPLTREEKREAKLDAGLVVEDVGGAAARAGVQAGDVLLAINGKPVQSIEQVRGVIAAKPKSVALLVQRDGEKIFVPVKVG